jgi:hypothetical protein
MATTTTNLGLRKPGTNDAVSVATDLSANMDLIDTAYSTLAPNSGVVHLTGTETITGAKTFSANITINNVDIVLNATTGTKIGTATTQKLGFYNATPVVQIAGATDVLAGLVTLGLRAASANPPLNLGSGALTAGASTLGATTTTTLGTGTITMTDATNIAVGTTTGTKIGTATSQKIGFFNATPVTQPTSTTDIKAAMVSLGLIAGAGASPLNLNGGAATLGATTVTTLGTGGDLTLADANNIVVNATTGTKIGTATTQKLGFFNATPVAQIAGSTDVLASLVTLGFRAASANPPLNLGSGALTAGATSLGATTTTTLGCTTITITDANNIVVGTTTGTKIGTATTQKLGFFNATPVVQEAGTNDVLASLVTLGLRAASSNPPLNLGSGSLTCGQITIADATNIVLNTTTGTKIGTATTQKLAFYNSTPIVKPTAYTQTYSTASKTHPNGTSSAVATTASTTTTPWGYTTQAQADAVPVAINAVRTDLDNLKQLVNSVIDDLQALGLVG